MSPIPFTPAPDVFIPSTSPELIVKNSFIDFDSGPMMLDFDSGLMMLERWNSAPALRGCTDTDSDCADADSDGNAQEAAGGVTPGGEALAEGGWADQFPGMDDIVRTVTRDGWNEGTEQRWDGYHKDFVQFAQSLEESLAVPQHLAMDPQGAIFCPAGPGAMAPRMPPPLEAPFTPTTPPTTPAAPSSPPRLPPMLPRPPGVELVVNGLHQMLLWTVDAKKLKTTDTQAVSPEFQLTFQQEQAVNFQTVIRPTPKPTRHGGKSHKFKQAGGKGSIELCCRDADPMIPPVSFRFSVCSGKNFANPELPPGALVSHDFTTKTTCPGQEEWEEWDFERAVDDATKTFIVCLEILPSSAAAASATL